MIHSAGYGRGAALSVGLAVALACCSGPHRTAPVLARELAASWPGSGGVRSVRLGEHEVVVMRGETASGLLIADGWVANADALEVVRALNPGVDVFDLAPGSSLHLPRLAGASAPAAPIELIVDQAKKRALIDELHRAVEAWRAARPGLQSAELQGALDAIAAQLTDLGARLDKRALITTDVLLAVVQLEAQQCAALVPELARAPASDEQRAQVARLGEDLRAQTRAFDDQHKGDAAVMTDQITVVVRTKRRARPGGGAEDAPGYRVWYQPMIVFRVQADGLPFGQLSPASREMVPGMYAFWATEERRGARRLGLLKSVLVERSRARSEALIELAVDAGGP